ncbi:MAG: glycosyltransferase family 39 protein [Bacteroidota bacterium]
MLRGRHVFYCISWCYFLFLVFYQLGDYQLEFYDEARRGVSALEMYQGKSHPLVPTYAGQPEHWGTKPPLLIWLQTTFVALLGPTELAIRLPAALATLAAIGLMVWFSNRQWGYGLVGTLAGWVLLSNWNFLGSHGARSGDFDAMLLLFTLGQVLFYYTWIQTKNNRYLYLAALALLLAGWTKGIAGCLFLPAIGLWTLLEPKARKQLLNWRLYTAFGLALMGIFSYYGVREIIDDSFLKIVANNELGGRFLRANEGHAQPWNHYFSVLASERNFLLFVLLVFPASLWMQSQREHRSLAQLLFLGLVVFLLVISLSTTKLFWYITPMLPFVSLFAAWFFIEAGQLMGASIRPSAVASAVVLLFIGLFFFVPTERQIKKVLAPEEHLGLRAQLYYQAAIQNPDFTAPYTVLTPEYHANARFYVEQQRILGRELNITSCLTVQSPKWSNPTPPLPLEVGQRVLICENNSWVWMATQHHYREIKEVSPCKLVEILGEKEKEETSNH